MAEHDRIAWSPAVVNGAAAILAALAEVAPDHRLDALALASKAYIEKPDSIPPPVTVTVYGCDIEGHPQNFTHEHTVAAASPDQGTQP